MLTETKSDSKPIYTSGDARVTRVIEMLRLGPLEVDAG